MYLQIFSEEIEQVQDERFRDFIVEAIADIEEDYYTETDIRLIKGVVKYSRNMLQTVDADDLIFDIFSAVGLLHLYCKWDMGVDDIYHMLKVRAELSKFQNLIGREQFNNIMLIIESQEGLQSPIPQVEPRIEDPVYNWILPMAIGLTREDVAIV